MKKLRSYLIPSMLAQVGMSCYVLADTFFISSAAGSDGIAALNLALPLFGLIFAFGSMIGVGCATCFSLRRAAKSPDAELFFTDSLLWSLAAAIPFWLFGLFAPRSVALLLGADETLLVCAVPYMRTILMTAPFFSVNFTFTAFVRNDGAPKIAMAATLISSLFNIVFDYILMFPLGMGMFGAALATGLSPIVSIAVCMCHYFSKRSSVRFSLRLPSVRRLGSACALGISGFVGEIANGVTIFVFNLILLSLAGNTAVAAYGVIANIAVVGIAVLNGIAQGLQPMASAAAGVGDEAAKRYIRTRSLVLASLFSLVIVLLLWIFAVPIVNVFNSEGSRQLADFAVTGLRLYSLGFLIAAYNIVTAGFYSAVGRGRDCFFVSVSRGLVAIVLCAVVMSWLFGVCGVWLAFPAAEALTFVLSLVIERKKRSRIR